MKNLIRIHCSTQSFSMQWAHSTHFHSTASTAPTDQYSEVVIVHICSLVHPGWLPGYINVTHTVIILTMAGLFLDRPHVPEVGIQVPVPRACGSQEWAVSKEKEEMLSLLFFPKSIFGSVYCISVCYWVTCCILLSCVTCNMIQNIILDQHTKIILLLMGKWTYFCVE